MHAGQSGHILNHTMSPWNNVWEKSNLSTKSKNEQGSLQFMLSWEILKTVQADCS